jgi:hypothetical protein
VRARPSPDEKLDFSPDQLLDRRSPKAEGGDPSLAADRGRRRDRETGVSAEAPDCGAWPPGHLPSGPRKLGCA